MSESFVDLTYRGLSLGRRIRLTEIRPSTGYLEVPAPMPVGTKIAIATEEGVAIEAVVARIHEQIGGSERTPGMRVTPALGDAAAASWWKERVALPELEPPPEPRPRGPVMVLPRTRTLESPPPAHMEERPGGAGEPAAAPAAPAKAADGGGAADAMLEPELLAQLGASEADPPIVDDGKKTVMMQSIDLSALGLEAGASGQFAASAAGGEAEDDGDGDGEGEGEGDGDDGEEAAAAPPGSNGDPLQPVIPADRKKPFGKKRKKRR